MLSEVGRKELEHEGVVSPAKNVPALEKIDDMTNFHVIVVCARISVSVIKSGVVVMTS